MTEGVRAHVWDLPVRICHWGFVALVPALWWTADRGDMVLHMQLGLTMLGLVLFRLFWGFAGSSTARFSSFLKGPHAVASYLRGNQPAGTLGHNPAGGWSTLALLLLIAAQATIGLFAQDVDGIESGPLTHLVSYDVADAARGWHESLFDILLAFVSLHVLAIAFYLIAVGDNLVGPMVTGRKGVPAAVPPADFAPHWRAVAGAMVCAGLMVWISSGLPPL